MDYELNIYNGDEYVCTVGSEFEENDDWLWTSLDTLIKKIESGKNTKEEILKDIKQETNYLSDYTFKYNEPKEVKYNLNIKTKEIEVPSIEVFLLEDANGYNTEFGDSISLENNKYYVSYLGIEGKDEVINDNSDIESLKSHKITFDQLHERTRLLNKCNDEGMGYIILNGTHMMKMYN